MKNTIFFLFFILMISNVILSETQTGNLIVAVQYEEGMLLPGAAITVSSPALRGTRTQEAEWNGTATFENLPIGIYKIDVTLNGFQPAVLSNVEISLQKVTKTEIIMKYEYHTDIVILLPIFAMQTLDFMFEFQGISLFICPVKVLQIIQCRNLE